MERVLLTGATGLIGSELLAMLIGEYECWVVGRKKCITHESIHFIEQDLGEDFNFTAFPRELDYIVHLAQGDGHNDFPNCAKTVFNVNVKGMMQLLDYGVKAKIKKFLFASTGGVYDNTGEPMPEDSVSLPQNLSFYQSTKLCSEILTQSYSQFYTIIAFRFYFVYGEGQKNKMLFPRLIDQIKLGQTIKIGSLNDIKLNPIYKSDAAYCVYLAMKNIMNTNAFNIAGDETVYMSEIVNKMAQLLGIKANIEFEDKQQMDMLGDNFRMKRYLCAPKVLLDEGISRMVLSKMERLREVHN